MKKRIMQLMMVVGVGCCVMSSQAEAASVSFNLGKDVRIVVSDYDGVRLKHRVVKKKKLVKHDGQRDKFRAKAKRKHRC